MVTATRGKAQRTATTFDSSGPQWVVVELAPSAADAPIGHDIAELKSLDQDHLGRAFEEVALRLTGRPAVVSDGGVVSYGDLLSAAHAVRQVLQTELQISQGDRVVILLPNSPEYVASFYGALLAGAVVVPLPPDAESSHLSHAISATDASVVLSSMKVLRRRKPELAAEPITLSLREFPASEVGHSDVLDDGDSPAAVFFTSGSSGEPKGVTLSHRNLLSNAASIIEYFGITSDERASVCCRSITRSAIRFCRRTC